MSLNHFIILLQEIRKCFFAFFRRKLVLRSEMSGLNSFLVKVKDFKKITSHSKAQRLKNIGARNDNSHFYLFWILFFPTLFEFFYNHLLKISQHKHCIDGCASKVGILQNMTKRSKYFSF